MENKLKEAQKMIRKLANWLENANNIIVDDVPGADEEDFNETVEFVSEARDFADTLI